jgi:hypothetical protein
MHAHHPLEVKCHTHFHKHVGTVGRFIVNAQARADAMTVRSLNGKHTVFDAIVCIGARADAHPHTGFAQELPPLVRQCHAVIENIVWAKKPLLMQ